MRAPLEVRVARGVWLGVETLHEAAHAVRQHIDDYGLASSTWGQARAPVRRTGDGKVVAVVSYNGRVWTPERDWERRTEIRGAALHAVGGAR